ncbi:MAG: energy transducer TonB [Blastocatellia bacterium]
MAGANRYKAIRASFGLIALLAFTAICQPFPRQDAAIPEVEAGVAIRRVEARYPDDARLLGVNGFVTVQAIVDERGNVQSARATSGPRPLRKAAEDAALRWRFKPGFLSGAPVRSVARISFHFELRASAVSKGEVQSRGMTVSAGSPTYRFSLAERKHLEKTLKKMPFLTIPIKESAQSPIEITAARLRYLKGPAQDAEQQDAYFMQTEVELENRGGDDRATAAGLQFSNTVTHSVFYVYPEHLSIGRRKRRRFAIRFMTLREDPSALSIRLVGAEFANRVVWGAFPFPPSPIPWTVAEADAPIDVAPVVLAKSMPTYTEDARADGILGSVGLRVLVSPEGRVKQVQVTNPLPDGLTQEAVRSVQGSLFKPAMSKGAPASCWLSLNIEFKSR